MFRTVRVDRNKAEATEPLGTKRKFWFIDGGQRYLFKAEERGTGEDWAEKLACEFSRRLGLPHVEYDLAEEYDGSNYRQPGVVCLHCAPPPLTLIMGNELLLAQDPRYPRADHRKYKITKYTVDAVVQCVRGLTPPASIWMRNVPEGLETALDRLDSRDQGRQIAHFATRARSAFYASPDETRTLGTLDAFVRFSAAAPKEAGIWLNTIKGVTENEIEAIVREVPPNRMSQVTRQFTQELIIVNQQRLVELS
jgi:hypothetical protein